MREDSRREANVSAAENNDMRSEDYKMIGNGENEEHRCLNYIPEKKLSREKNDTNKRKMIKTTRKQCSER